MSTGSDASERLEADSPWLTPVREGQAMWRVSQTADELCEHVSADLRATARRYADQYLRFDHRGATKTIAPVHSHFRAFASSSDMAFEGNVAEVDLPDGQDGRALLPVPTGTTMACKLIECSLARVLDGVARDFCILPLQVILLNGHARESIEDLHGAAALYEAFAQVGVPPVRRYCLLKRASALGSSGNQVLASSVRDEAKQIPEPPDNGRTDLWASEFVGAAHVVIDEAAKDKFETAAYVGDLLCRSLSLIRDRHGSSPSEITRAITDMAADKGFAIVLKHAGTAFHRVGDLGQAEQCFKDALLLSPGDRTLCFHLMDIEADRKDFEAAYSYLQQAVATGVSNVLPNVLSVCGYV